MKSTIHVGRYGGKQENYTRQCVNDMITDPVGKGQSRVEVHQLQFYHSTIYHLLVSLFFPFSISQSIMEVHHQLHELHLGPMCLLGAVVWVFFFLHRINNILHVDNDKLKTIHLFIYGQITIKILHRRKAFALQILDCPQKIIIIKFLYSYINSKITVTLLR